MSVLGLLLGLLGYLVGDIENVIVPIYMIITYRQLFGYGWWGTLWRCIVTYLSVLVMLLPLVTIVFLVGYSEGGVNVTIGFGDSEFSLSEAGPILLSILILLIAVMLYITHRINKRTYHSRE